MLFAKNIEIGSSLLQLFNIKLVTFCPETCWFCFSFLLFSSLKWQLQTFSDDHQHLISAAGSALALRYRLLNRKLR